MNVEGIQRTFEQFVNPDDSIEQQRGKAVEYVECFRRDLGIRQNKNGRPTLVAEEAAASADSFSIHEMAVAYLGYDCVSRLMESTNDDFRVFEAGGAGAIGPGSIPNVSAFLGSVQGLLDASLLEGYEQPEFVIDQLIPVLPSKTKIKKLIGLGRIGDKSKRRNPGDPHEAAQFADRVVKTQETYNDALKMDVTYEAVFYDQTSEVLEQAQTIGRELALRKELDGFGLLAGVTNPYNYNDVSYNTYLTSGNWINDVQNELNDWTDVNVVNAMFSRMTDQETSNRIAVNWDTLVCSPTKAMTAAYIQSATEVETRTASGNEIRRASRLGDTKKVVSSPYLDQVLTAAAADGGLALSQANADEYWWALKTTKGQSAFVRVENWPFRVQRARPDDYHARDHKIVLSVFADQMHSFDVREPRYVIRCKNE